MHDQEEESPSDAAANNKQRADEGRKNREEMDAPPPQGTDPLHEGP